MKFRIAHPLALNLKDIAEGQRSMEIQAGKDYDHLNLGNLFQLG